MDIEDMLAYALTFVFFFFLFVGLMYAADSILSTQDQNCPVSVVSVPDVPQAPV